MKQEEKDRLLNEQHTIVLECESKLSSYDYIGTKIAMGVATKKDYAAEIAETETWRKTLREANERIKELEAIEVEPDEPTTEEEA